MDINKFQEFYDENGCIPVANYIHNLGVFGQSVESRQVLFVKNNRKYFYYYKASDADLSDEYDDPEDYLYTEKISLNDGFKRVLYALHQMNDSAYEMIASFGNNTIPKPENEYLDLLYDIKYVFASLNYASINGAEDSSFMGNVLNYVTGPIINSATSPNVIYTPVGVEKDVDDWKDCDELFSFVPKRECTKTLTPDAQTEEISRKLSTIPPEEYLAKINPVKWNCDVWAFKIDNNIQLALTILLLCHKEGIQIKKCKKCGSLFIADNPKEEFCGDKCRRLKKIDNDRKFVSNNLDEKRALVRTRKLFRDRSERGEKFDISLLWLSEEANALFGDRFKYAIEHHHRSYKEFSETLKELVDYEEVHNPEFDQWIQKLGKVGKKCRK